MVKYASRPIMKELRGRFTTLYGEERARLCLERLAMLVGRYGIGLNRTHAYRYWDQADSVLITYGDMVRTPGEKPLKTLKSFADQHLRGALSTIHILPFFPYSSDDGFSVIDYRTVNPELGTWDHVEELSEDFSLMFDLVLNHVSRSSEWFSDYVLGVAPARHYFIEVDPNADLSSVTRPRSTPLLSRTLTRDGERFLWATFSDDQLDLDFANPDVLFEFLDILLLYISRGARIIRLDAIAYLWKRLGTSCIHLPEAHEVVKLIRNVIDLAAPDVSILTETNVPHEENISYFGDGDEAHIVYQFTLPPLLMHGLLSGNAAHLTKWADELTPPPQGCTYLNFTASHDGIGVRPLEGIIDSAELESVVEHVLERGGQVSTKSNPDGSQSPYELNITYFDVLGKQDDDLNLHVARFLCSQTVALALRGIPAVYFNSLIAGPNYARGVEETGRARTVNRQKWQIDQLNDRLADKASASAMVFDRYRHLLRLRAAHKAFHPDGQQVVHDVGPDFFVVERTSPKNEETIVSISNFTGESKTLSLDGQIPALDGKDEWRDIITDKMRGGKSHRVRLKPYETCWIVA